MWESLLGPLVGAFAGGGDDEQTSVSKNEPWAPAQPFMLRNLQDTEKLGNYYKQNPFNQQQIESYSNLFNDNNNFRQNIAPGLMDFANQGMTSTYKRATGGRPGDGAGYGGARQPGGRSGGLLDASPGPFSVGQSGASSGGLLDLNGAQNPFANGGIAPNPQTVTEEMIDAIKQEIGLGDSPGNDAGDNQPGGGFGGVNDGFKGLQDMINTPFGAMTVSLAAQLGLLGSLKQQAPAPVEDRSSYMDGNGSAGMSFGGYGSFGAGDYGDGTDR